MKKELKAIEDLLVNTPLGPNPSKWKAKDYIGGGKSKLVYLDLKIPQIRKTVRAKLVLNQMDKKSLWKIWDYAWNHSVYFEVMLCSLHFAASRPKEELYKNKRLLLNWINRVDNWAHSDDLSKIYSILLEHYPEELLPVFKKWNRSDNPWKKRQSMVALLFYSRFRKSHPSPDLILEFVNNHLLDNHYYVQKGVGWTLRECWNVYPKVTYKYLCQNAQRIPPGAWTAATEKLSASEKEKLKSLRKNGAREK